MNWVGGSRTRVLIKQERRKQKEYFERNRLKSKMKLLGVLSPVKNSTVSLDLLNLYMVNQISCKKKTPETVKKPVHVNMNRDIKMTLRHQELEFPVSPHCIPSKLCLDDTENNIHYQKLDRKEELGEVQLSNVNYSKSLISKNNESQEDFTSSYETAPSGTLFEGLISPGNGNFLTKRSAVITGQDCGSMDGRGQLDFIIKNQSVLHIWGENGNKVSDFLDMKQPTNSLLSENCDSFVHQNMINLLSIDQQRIKKTFDNCDYDSLGATCLIASSDENHCTDGSIRDIFVVPESTFNNSAFNKTSTSEQYQLKKNYQKEHNSNEVNDLSTSFENCYSTNFEEKGILENDYQEKTQQENTQEYPVNSVQVFRGNIRFEELHPKPLLDFGLDKVPVEGGTCFLKDRPASTQKICQCNWIILDSSQSSQSESYSPRPTDSCFSSSSEMLSEDEDQILQQTEDSNKKRTLKRIEATNNFYLKKVAKLSSDNIVKDDVQIYKQNEDFHQLLMKNNTDQFPQSKYNSAHTLQSKTSNNYILQVARCDAGVQTDREPTIEGKIDAAIQCDIVPKCPCRSDMSPCSSQRCNENIKADTTGGQESLKNS